MGDVADDQYDTEMREDECDHEDYEVDILTSRATCTVCGHVWYQTKEEIAADHERQIEYARLCEVWDAEAALAEAESHGTVSLDELKRALKPTD